MAADDAGQTVAYNLARLYESRAAHERMAEARDMTGRDGLTQGVAVDEEQVLDSEQVEDARAGVVNPDVEAMTDAVVDEAEAEAGASSAEQTADEGTAGADDLSDEPMPEQPLELFGDNSGFGTERVELNGLRHVDPAVRDDDAFPFGVQGMLPVVTSRKKKGGFKTVYAFPFAEGEPPADDQLAGELRAAVDFINELLAEAADLSGYPFGAITALWMGVPEKGYSFTRVERVEQTVRADQRPSERGGFGGYGYDGRGYDDRDDDPRGGSADQSVTVTSLRIETTPVAGTPNTLSAVLEYDANGYARHALMTETGEGGHTCYATASLDYRENALLIDRVMEQYPDERPVKLYYRDYNAWRYEDEGDDYDSRGGYDGYDDSRYDDRRYDDRRGGWRDDRRDRW